MNTPKVPYMFNYQIAYQMIIMVGINVKEYYETNF